jgi:hypothetical protein
MLKTPVMKQILDWIYLLHLSNTLKEKEKEDEREDNITRVAVEDAHGYLEIVLVMKTY